MGVVDKTKLVVKRAWNNYLYKENKPMKNQRPKFIDKECTQDMKDVYKKIDKLFEKEKEE